jgi:hypothetical protein
MGQRSFRSLIPKHPVSFRRRSLTGPACSSKLDSRSPQPLQAMETSGGRGRRMAGTGGSGTPLPRSRLKRSPRCGPNVRLGASGSRRAATDRRRTNTTVAELWQIVGGLGRCYCATCGHPMILPSVFNLPMFMPARLVGSDTEREVTWAAPEVPSSHRSAVRNRPFLRQPALPRR